MTASDSDSDRRERKPPALAVGSSHIPVLKHLGFTS